MTNTDNQKYIDSNYVDTIDNNINEIYFEAASRYFREVFPKKCKELYDKSIFLKESIL